MPRTYMQAISDGVDECVLYAAATDYLDLAVPSTELTDEEYEEMINAYSEQEEE